MEISFFALLNHSKHRFSLKKKKKKSIYYDHNFESVFSCHLIILMKQHFIATRLFKFLHFLFLHNENKTNANITILPTNMYNNIYYL